MLAKLSPIFQSYTLKGKKVAKHSLDVWNAENLILLYLIVGAIISLAFIKGPSGFIDLFFSLLK